MFWGGLDLRQEGGEGASRKAGAEGRSFQVTRDAHSPPRLSDRSKCVLVPATLMSVCLPRSPPPPSLLVPLSLPFSPPSLSCSFSLPPAPLLGIRAGYAWKRSSGTHGANKTPRVAYPTIQVPSVCFCCCLQRLLQHNCYCCLVFRRARTSIELVVLVLLED